MRFMQIKFKNNWIPNFIVLYFKNIGGSLIRLPLQAPAQDCEVVVGKVIGRLCFSLRCRSFRNRMWEQTPKGISWKKKKKWSWAYFLFSPQSVFFQRHLRVSLYRAMSCKPQSPFVSSSPEPPVASWRHLTTISTWHWAGQSANSQFRSDLKVYKVQKFWFSNITDLSVHFREDVPVTFTSNFNKGKVGYMVMFFKRVSRLWNWNPYRHHMLL